MKILRLGTGIRKLIKTIYVLYNDQSGLNLSNDFVRQAKRFISRILFLLRYYLHIFTQKSLGHHSVIQGSLRFSR